VARDAQQVAIVSGKGGTGKTTLVASLVSLAAPVACADCDVDAPNLHLVLAPQSTRSREFWGGRQAVRDASLCRGAGECETHCRFGAIDRTRVYARACEGCGFCVAVCPSKALRLAPALTGHIHVSETRYGPMAHATLAPGAENSGRLATEVRAEALAAARQAGADLVLIDGPPGTGCGAIASVVGADYVLVVTEPTVSGVHDLGRVLELGLRLGLRMGVILGKADLDATGAEAVRECCHRASVPVLAELPYDEAVARSIVAGRPHVEVDTGLVAQGIRLMWESLREVLGGDANTHRSETAVSGALVDRETPTNA
jgi:MinD superfamily P-loop ATPase